MITSQLSSSFLSFNPATRLLLLKCKSDYFTATLWSWLPSHLSKTKHNNQIQNQTALNSFCGLQDPVWSEIWLSSTNLPTSHVWSTCNNYLFISFFSLLDEDKMIRISHGSAMPPASSCSILPFFPFAPQPAFSSQAGLFLPQDSVPASYLVWNSLLFPLWSCQHLSSISSESFPRFQGQVTFFVIWNHMTLIISYYLLIVSPIHKVTLIFWFPDEKMEQLVFQTWINKH